MLCPLTVVELQSKRRSHNREHIQRCSELQDPHRVIGPSRKRFIVVAREERAADKRPRHGQQGMDEIAAKGCDG
jgi:hypothetical protein